MLGPSEDDLEYPLTARRSVCLTNLSMGAMIACAGLVSSVLWLCIIAVL